MKMNRIAIWVGTLGKGMMCFNLALAIRALRFGFGDSRRKAMIAYYGINPFQSNENGKDGPGARDYISFKAIPEVPLEEVIERSPTITLDGCYRYVDGALPLNDLISLLCLLRDRSPRVVLEIGTFNGITTRLMAINLPGATIHTVDLPEDFDTKTDIGSFPKDDFHLITKRRVGESYRSDSSVTNVVQHYGDTANWDFSNAPKAEFFFIDGSHTYNYVKNDTEKCIAAILGRRATILWHDCDPRHPGVVRWLAEMTTSGYAVKRIAGTDLAVMDLDDD
jgi:Methyltransferase domain